MTIDEVLQKCYDDELSLIACEALLTFEGYSGCSEDWIADRLEEIYCETEGK